MNLFDAINQVTTTISTSGYSTKKHQQLGYMEFRLYRLSYVIIPFMFIGGTDIACSSSHCFNLSAPEAALATEEFHLRHAGFIIVAVLATCQLVMLWNHFVPVPSSRIPSSRVGSKSLP